MRFPWKLSVFLWHGTPRLYRALQIILDRVLCCDKITALVDRVLLGQAVVIMVPITLDDHAAFHVTALELYRQYRYKSKNGKGQVLIDIVL